MLWCSSPAGRPADECLAAHTSPTPTTSNPTGLLRDPRPHRRRWPTSCTTARSTAECPLACSWARRWAAGRAGADWEVLSGLQKAPLKLGGNGLHCPTAGLFDMLHLRAVLSVAHLCCSMCPSLQELEAVGAGPELDRMVAEFEASRKAKQAAGAGRR